MSPKIIENAARWKPVFWRVVQSSGGVQIPVVETPPVPPPAPPPVPQGPPPEAVWARKVEDARKQGMADGMARVQADLAAQTAAVIQKLGAAITEMERHRERITAEATGDVVQLALSIAKRILSRELQVDPEAVTGLVSGALAKVKPRDLQRVRVHMAHLAQVHAALNGSTVEIVADPAAQLGDVFLETAHGGIDASAWTQLREIERGLADRTNP